MGKLLKKLQRNSGRLLRFVLPRKKYWMQSVIFYLALVLVGVVVYNASVAQADGMDILRWVGYVLAELATWAARVFMALAVFLLRFFIQLAGYNGYLDAPVVKVGWVMVRDLANMFFVVALLVIAFITILGKENYAWQKAMVKLVLVAIFINFSMLICGLVIDAAHVFTMTFLNAVAPTAGGNLIELFNLEAIQSMVVPSGESATAIQGSGELTLDIFVAAALAAMLAAITMVTIGAYAIIMLVRLVALWVLIILSPLAFIFSILPNTESYAKEWMSQFTRYVIVAPLMVFFLWLSFATLSGVADHLGAYSSVADARFQADAQTAADVGQSVSINLGTTWHNLAGFLVATALLLIGIGQVQQSKVMGAGWAAAGISFGKKVATIATGYAAGRWLVGKAAGKAKEGARDWLSDYGKLIGGKTGLSKLPIIGSQRAGLIRRKAAVEKMEEMYVDRKTAIEKLGGGLAGRLFAPSYEERAKAAVARQAAEKISLAKRESAVAKYSVKKYVEQMNTFNSTVRHDEKIKAIEDEAMAANGGKGRMLTPDEFKQIQARKQEILKGMTDKGGWLGTPEASMATATLLEDKAEFEKRETEGKIKWILGQYGIGKVKNEMAIKQGRFEEIKARLTQDRIEEIKISPNYTGRLQALEAEGLSEDEAAEQIFLQDGELGRQVEGEAMKQAIVGLPVMQMLYKEGKKAQKMGKYDFLQLQMAADLETHSRFEENKDEKPWTRLMDEEVASNMADNATKDVHKLFREISIYHGQLRELGYKEKNNEPMTDEQKVALKNARKHQMMAVASALERGYGGALLNMFYDLDENYENIETNNPEQIHKSLLGILTGATAADLLNDNELAAQQERLRAGMADKQEQIFKTLHRAVDTAALDKGFGQVYGVVQEGVDQSGKRIMGFAPLMKKGLGSGFAGRKGTRLGTGDVKKDAEAYRKDKYEGFFMPDMTFDSCVDGRAYTIVAVETVAGKKEQIADKYVSDSHRKAVIEGITKKNAGQIAALDTAKLRYISGGSYGQSSAELWAKTLDEGASESDKAGFLMKDNIAEGYDIAEGFREIHKELFRQFAEAKSATSRDQSLQKIKNLYKQWGVDFDNFVEVKKGEVENLENFIQDPEKVKNWKEVVDTYLNKIIKTY